MKYNYFEKNPKKTILVFILIFIAIIDFSIKGSINLYNYIYYGDSIKDIVTAHPNYSHTFKKNKKVSINDPRGNYKIITNSLGFKDKEIRQVDLSTNKKRILLIGDSFTEGILLNYENTFAGIFDEYLKKLDIELLNAGRGGYSPIIYWAKIKYLIEIEKLKFDELFVFIDISDTWDEYYNFTLDNNNNVILKNQNNTNNNKKNETANLKIFLKNNTILTYQLLNYLYDTFINPIDKNEYWYSYFSDIHFYKWIYDDQTYNEWGKEGVKSQIYYMNKLKKLLDENQIELTIAIYPWINLIINEELNSRYVEIWEKWSNENNADFINLIPYFVKENITEQEKDKIINNNYIKGDFHFNKNGNKIIADVLIEKFEIR
tara:strand:- start:377 stop:1501 length:1125 start_codon:yes stop_codon:yes gene_type:complete